MLNELLLLENDAFRDVIQFGKPRKVEILEDENINIWAIEKYLGAFFSRFAWPGGECFSPTFKWSTRGNANINLKGRPNLFSELCMKGDFSLYEKYIGTLKKSQLRSDNYATHGIFALMVFFMRFDLVENYIHYQDCIWEVNEILHFVLDPTIMVEYKNLLLKDGMIPLTKEDEYRMDIIQNIDKYHPKKRILMFYKLCYSTHLALSYSSRRVKYWRDHEIYTHEKLRELVNSLYHSFDYFVQKWHLMEYKDVANDKRMQHKMHNQIKMLIQYFFGFCHLSLSHDKSRRDAFLHRGKKRGNTVSQARIREQGVECTVSPFYQFVDLLPQNETELKRLFYHVYMDNNEKWVNLGRNTITHYLEYPRFDHLYQQQVQPSNSTPFHFDPISKHKVFQFFCHVWEIWKIE